MKEEDARLAGAEKAYSLDVSGDCASFGVGHEASRPQLPSQAGYFGHHVRRGHQLIKIHHASSDLIDEVFLSSKVCSCCFCSFLLLPFAQHSYSELLTCSLQDMTQAASQGALSIALSIIAAHPCLPASDKLVLLTLNL